MRRREFFLTPMAAITAIALADMPAEAKSSQRYSVDPQDPGHHPLMELWADEMTVRVYLDGVHQKHCTTCDVGLGFIDRHVLDGKGRPVLNYTRDEILSERVYGEVRVEYVPRWGRNHLSVYPK